MKQQVKRISLTGGITKVSFDHVCGDYYASTNKAYIVVEYTKKGV